MGKWILVGVLALFGLGLLSDYPIVGFGMLCAAGLIGWMALQGRRAVRVSHARPTAARQARQEVQQEVNLAQRQANRAVRGAVERARREAQTNLASAVQRVEAEQRERWVA